MNFYSKAAVWEKDSGIPHTSKYAKPNALVKVKNANVIVVNNAQYRNAEFSGTFLLSEHSNIDLSKEIWHTVEVDCCWFGHRLKTRGLHFKVNMTDAAIKLDIDCSVVSNLSA